MLAPLLVALACLSGCSVVAGHPVASRRLDAPAGQVVLQVSGGGGLAPADWYLGHRPGTTIYASGDAYVLDVESRDFPGTPLGFRRGAVPRAELAELVTELDRTGLFAAGTDFGDPQITDSPTTTVTFRPDRGAAITVSAYALSWTEGDRTLSTVQAVNRAVLRKILDRIDDSVRLESESWTPARIDVTEADERSGDTGAATPWPGPPLDQVLRPGALDRRCGLVSGAAAVRVYRSARTHGTLRWAEAGSVHRLVVRALLPGEVPCRR